MFKNLLVDSKLKNYVTNEHIDLLKKNKIIIEYIDSPHKVYNNEYMFLTNDINNISDYCNNIFLISNSYDILSLKNVLYINKIEDIVKIYEKSFVFDWAIELQSIAQSTLSFSSNEFELNNARRLREISCEMLSYKYNLEKEYFNELFKLEKGYQTPKIENRAVVFKNNKLLLVREKMDGKWALPGGYQDVNKTLKENIIKECYEEAGAIVNPEKVIAFLNYNNHHDYKFPGGMMKVFVFCDYIRHSFEKNIETSEIEFFDIDNLPDLSLTRNTFSQIKMCFDFIKNKDSWETIFE